MSAIPVEPARRQRKSAEQRTRDILAAATLVFARNGFRGADMQHVADHAGVGKGTVYRFYPTKEELFRAVVDDAMQRLTAQIETAVNGIDDPFEYLRISFRAYMAFFQANPDTIELFVHERSEWGTECKPSYFVYKDSHSDEWLAMCERMVASGLCRITDPILIQDLVGNLAYGTMLVNRISGRNAPLLEQADALLDGLFRGILRT
ncbi:MAG: TetR/AcrR family transcriptional regulator [Gammaproteobacteria bacterium]|nr:TetR/AcrR family transcriptional regulator [Gammaproteobacteria bacterium]